MRKFYFVIIMFFLAGCGTSSYNVKKGDIQTKVDLREAVFFVDNIEDFSEGRYLDTNDISKTIVNGIKNEIKNSSKYKLTEDKSTTDYVLHIKVFQFTPGNRALRFWVGFGAGAAKLTFDCQLFDNAGNLVDTQKFQRFGAASLRSGNSIIEQMKHLIILYSSKWICI